MGIQTIGTGVGVSFVVEEPKGVQVSKRNVLQIRKMDVHPTGRNLNYGVVFVIIF